MKRNPFIKKILPQLDTFLGIAVIVAVFCLIFILAHKTIADLDIWLHLKAGEVIWQNKTVPAKDIFSFTLPAKPWVDHEWLFQVFSYLVYDKWQAAGLVSLQAFIITLSFFILLLMGIKSATPYLETGAFIFITAYASCARFNIRPDMFSLFFFVFYLYLLRFQINTRKIWLIPLAQVFWSNIHGYFFLGPLVTFFFILSEFLRRSSLPLPRGIKKEFALDEETYLRLKRVFFLTVLACFLNPYGAGGAFYPLFVLREMFLGKVRIFFKYIQELQPTFASGPGGFYYSLLFSCLFLMLANFKRLKIVEVVLFVFFFVFMLTLRNVAFFAAVCYLIIISYLAPTLVKMSGNVQLRIRSNKALAHLLRCCLCVIFIIWLAQRIDAVRRDIYYDFSSHGIKNTHSGIDRRGYPASAVDFILKNNLPLHLVNDFNSGAYLIGRAYPARQVFIDGRTEFYGPDFFQEEQKMMEGDKNAFAGIVSKYNIEGILLTYARASLPDAIKYIYNSPDWKLVFLDDTAVIFLKDTPGNKPLIKKYQIDLNKYLTPAPDFKELGIIRIYPGPYIKRASLFNLLEKDDLVIREAKEALRIMPDCFKAYQLIAKVYLRRGRYQEALENLRAALLILPQESETLVDLGKCLIKLKENTYALKALQGAARMNPRYGPAYCQLGIVYLMQHNTDEAVRALKKAAKYSPKDPLSHFNLGKAFYAQGKRKKDSSYIKRAKHEFKEAVQLNMQRKIKIPLQF